MKLPTCRCQRNHLNPESHSQKPTMKAFRISFQQSSGPSVGKKKGSALLLTLLVVSLLLVIVLSFVVMVRMELRQSINRQELFEARANARMGAMIALGELQKAMGPDMRISARADILSVTNADHPDTGVPPFNAHPDVRFWTGAWTSEAWNAGNPADRQGRFLRWLVSLPNTSSEAINAVESGSSLIADLSDDSLTVPLARHGLPSVPGDPESRRQVRAYRKDIDGRGEFAWWVSDEGVKANLSLTDPNEGDQQSTLLADIPRFLFPHRPNFSATEWFENVDFNDANLKANLPKVASLASGSFAFMPVAGNISADAADVLAQGSVLDNYTFFSHGVLSDTRRGGLRKDLSLLFWRDNSDYENLMTFVSRHGNTLDTIGPFKNKAFENNYRGRRIFNYQNYPQAEQTIRSPAAEAKNFFTGRWEVLYDFHNSFQKLDDPGNPGKLNAKVIPFEIEDRFVLHDPVTDGGSRNSTHKNKDVLHLEAPGSIDGIVEGNPVSSGLSPVLLRAAMEFRVVSVPKPGASGVQETDGDGNKLFNLNMWLTPMVTLWNPYNIDISYADDTGAFIGEKLMHQNLILRWRYLGTNPLEFTIVDEDGDRVTIKLEKEQIDGSVVDGLINTYEPEMTFDYSTPGSDIVGLEAGEIRVFTPKGSGADAGIEFEESEDTFELSSIFSGEDYHLILSSVISDKDYTEGEAISIITKIEGDDAGPNIDTSGLGSGRGFVISAPKTETYENSLTIGTDQTAPLGILEFHAQPGDPGVSHDYNPRRFADFNLRALYPKGHNTNAYGGQIPNYWYGFLPNVDIILNYQKTADPNRPMRGYWGLEAGIGRGESFISLFDVPRRPPESIAQYQHAHLANFFANQPTYPLGNSVADPLISRSFAVDFTNNRTFIDVSWLLNDSIWDGYFLSTIDPYDIDNQNPVRIAPLRKRFVELDETVVYDETGADSAESDYSEVAENLLLQGAFNVNSTSVEAWVSLLSGLGGEGIRYIDPGNKASFKTTTDLNYPFYRSTVPIGDTNTGWTGGPRDLERSEIRTLAENIVDEVRKRGPFLSLSDFINRRLTNDERGLKGALQAAIDEDETNIQDVITDSGTVDLPGVPYPGNVVGKPLDFVPGYLTQADILTTIGPLITARSDTFIIRSYGSLHAGDREVEAWCEMIVQRFPEEEPEANMGRRFRILHISYLDENQF